MSDGRRVKVTIIVEDGDTTQTMKITKASDLSFTTNAVANMREWPTNRAFFQDIVDVNFSLTAYFDPEVQRIYAVETKSVGREVRDDER